MFAVDRAPFQKLIDALKAELRQLNAGRASPALVEHAMIEAYGTKVPLIELASISAPEPRQIVIQPWNKTILKDIERGLSQSPLGITPVVDGQLIRLNLPALTEERRRELVKVVSGILEKARVKVRSVREEVLKQARELERSGKLSEDELFASQKELQRLVDDYNEQIKATGKQKEIEIMTM